MKLWIARDSYGLWLFRKKPTKYLSNGDKCFNKVGNTRYIIDSTLFPEVTFENSPQEVELKLVGNGISN
ncbi:MAG: hypothetical protein U0M06_02650 [Clostridia bacterium]|nr:hypothetical protein [Clostridia bacterium]